MSLIETAFTQLYPEKHFDYTSEIKYSRKFKPYNARVSWRGRHLVFRLSALWREVDESITLGLIQVLLLKVLKLQASTSNIELYHSFLKRLPDYSLKGESDAQLEASFFRVNPVYFSGLLEQPTLQWGSASTTTLAHYSLHTDTITVSTIFRDAPEEILDYVMHHEMLHKKHRFVASGKNSRFHTIAFREDERKFSGAVRLEEDLKRFLRQKKRGLRLPRFLSWL